MGPGGDPQLDSLSLSEHLVVILCICSCLLSEEASLMIGCQDTDL